MQDTSLHKHIVTFSVLYIYLATFWQVMSVLTGLEIKKILRSPFGDKLEKYSRQVQIFICQFV